MLHTVNERIYNKLNKQIQISLNTVIKIQLGNQY